MGLKDVFELVEKAFTIAKAMSHTELQSTIVDLKTQLNALKQENMTLFEENNRLKNNHVSTSKPSVQWGCYKFDDDERLYCPACWDTQRKKCLTTRRSTHLRVCCVCKRFGTAKMEFVRIQVGKWN